MAEAIERAVRRVARDAQWLLQARAADRAALAAALGLDLPAAMLTAAASEEWTALHLGPDEWLLVGPDGAAPTMAEGAPPHALVDVSHRSLGVELSGPDAIAHLSGACGLDLERMGEGACTRTLFGKITVLLWRRGEAWRIVYPRSYDDYVLTLLAATTPDAV